MTGQPNERRGWLKSSSVAEGVLDLMSYPANSVANGAEDAAAVDRVELRIGQLDTSEFVCLSCVCRCCRSRGSRRNSGRSYPTRRSRSLARCRARGRVARRARIVNSGAVVVVAPRTEQHKCSSDYYRGNNSGDGTSPDPGAAIKAGSVLRSAVIETGLIVTTRLIIKIAHFILQC